MRYIIVAMLIGITDLLQPAFSPTLLLSKYLQSVP